MKSEDQFGNIYAVIQFGGTCNEQYLHSFPDENDAAKYIKEAERASYRCLGPFPISLAAECKLVRRAAKVVRWLKTRGLGKNPHTRDLELAVTDVRKNLRCS